MAKEAARAQSAIEFFIIVGAVFLFFIVFLGAIQSETSVRLSEGQDFELKEITKSAQRELFLAQGASSGYERVFTVPETMSGGGGYSIQLADGLIYVSSDDGEHALALSVPNVFGTIQKGENVVIKAGELICLNVAYLDCVGQPICGNGLDGCVDDSECDDDNLDERCVGGTCVEFNSLGEQAEDCDDGGNGNDNDACTNSCNHAFCGDGITCFYPSCSPFEYCDDGNQINGDGCENDCTETGGDQSSECGNGIWEWELGEECDPSAPFEEGLNCGGLCAQDCTCNVLEEEVDCYEGSASITQEPCPGMNENTANNNDANIDACFDGEGGEYMYIENIQVFENIGGGLGNPGYGVADGNDVYLICRVCCAGSETKWGVAHKYGGGSWEYLYSGSCEDVGDLNNCVEDLYSTGLMSVNGLGSHYFRCMSTLSKDLTGNTCAVGTFADNDDVRINVVPAT